MKRYFLMLMAVGVGYGAACAQTDYLSQIGMTEKRVEKTAEREVFVGMKLDFSRLQIKRQHSLRLVPVLVSADGTQQYPLPAVYVNGTVRQKVNARIEAVDDSRLYSDADTVICRRNGTPQEAEYCVTLPFRRWMIGSELQVRGYVAGCAACEAGNETAVLGGVLPPLHPTYLAETIIPEEEIVKRRSETKSARLQFRQNSAVIEPGFSTNRAELDSVVKSISMVKNNSDLTITGIYVTGYSSPEGGFEYNMKLSERRAKSFTEYMKDDMKGIPAKLYHVDWKGEDWDGVRAGVMNQPDFPQLEKILEIIDHCGDDKDVCDARLRALQPASIYQRLLNEMYPAVRRNDYRVEYNVRHFDLQEGKEMIYIRPDLMSVSEIQKVADSYGKGTPQYADCLKAGLKGHPSDVILLNNTALALIDVCRYDEAIALLREAPEDAALRNVLGMAYLRAERLQEADAAFGQAASMGSKEGKQNLDTLRGYMEYYSE